MQRFTLRLVVALITFTLGVTASAVWIIYHLSPAEKPGSSEIAAARIATLSASPTAAFCDLIAHPADFNQRVIRTEADLFSYHADLSLSDPSSCVLPHPMVGIELDPSFQYDADDGAKKEVYELLTSGERKDARFRIAMVGRFEGPIFAEGRTIENRTGRYEFKNGYKYPYRFTIMRLEKAEHLR